MRVFAVNSLVNDPQSIMTTFLASGREKMTRGYVTKHFGFILFCVQIKIFVVKKMDLI